MLNMNGVEYVRESGGGDGGRGGCGGDGTLQGFWLPFDAMAGNGDISRW